MAKVELYNNSIEKNSEKNPARDSFSSSPTSQKSTDEVLLVSIEEYRNILKDNVSSDERIIKKLEYLENFCRKIIRMEFEKLTKVDL